MPVGEPTKTFVGTAQYVSPELLEHNESSKRYVPTDVWLGMETNLT